MQPWSSLWLTTLVITVGLIYWAFWAVLGQQCRPEPEVDEAA